MEEFEAHMKNIVTEARNKIQNPVFSYDNNSTQRTANMQHMGITPAEKLPLAAYMPDAHQCIEHCFGIIKPAFRKELPEVGGCAGARELQRMLRY